MTTKSLREEFGYTQKELAERYSIPLRTLQNWDSRECMPEYVFMMIYQCEKLMAENLKLKSCIRQNLSWGADIELPEDIEI